MPLLRPRGNSGSPLTGLVVVLPRSADRAGAMVAELAGRGAEPKLMPLIDFEEPESSRELDEALRMLGQGRFEWMVITSITTVRALKQRAAALGTTLKALSGDTRIAAVGSVTAQVLEAEGLHVDLVPEGTMDAVGLVADWPPPGEPRPETALRTNVFLPQADIAADTIFEGLMDKGWQVLPVVAYHTVDHPARAERRLTAVLESVSPAPGGAELESITVEDFNRGVAEKAIDAVVLTSPSVARRLHELAPSLPPHVLLVAIGNSTAREAESLGLDIAATATAPTPAGIADALTEALKTRTAPKPKDDDELS